MHRITHIHIYLRILPEVRFGIGLRGARPRKEPNTGLQLGLTRVKFGGRNEQRTEEVEVEVEMEGSEDLSDDMLHVVVALAIVII
ncbi:hypothetical protein HanRHA438_Chr08g0359301 [Helianthus annuus]|nr:hypothetical protein HanRHA438_Chr08g0359301 [Helianthus annuus]